MKALLLSLLLLTSAPAIAAVSFPPQPAQAQALDLYVVDDAIVNTLIKDGRVKYGASGSKFVVGYTFRLGRRSNSSQQVKVRIIERITDRTTGNSSFILQKL